MAQLLAKKKLGSLLKTGYRHIFYISNSFQAEHGAYDHALDSSLTSMLGSRQT
jgi:hypothetical protein